ncbi:Retrovirus-related Pol polyprotein from transposon opus [Exaiptasia diaphana]|nr:Retrovirus-related Pol polyprotein from transposon opus [Exaiptasia diaphana]
MENPELPITDYRNLSKDPDKKPEEYYKKPQLEISTLRSAMPDEALSVIPVLEHKPKSSTVRARLGSICETGRDKFIFGLSKNAMGTELLKSHRKSDQTKKTLEDVVSEAKAIESATRANKMMQESLKIEEDVNQLSHRQMNLRREPGTCHWCGDPRGPHAWRVCPASGKTCSKCGGNDHFARVCLQATVEQQQEPKRTYDNPRETTRGQFYSRGQRSQRGARGQRYNWRGRQQRSGNRWGQPGHEIHYTDYDHDTDDYQAQCYSLEAQNISFQIDTAATCNTISKSTLQQSLPSAKVTTSSYVLHPYGNGSPIRPVGQVELVCKTDKKFSTLTFQVLPDDLMKGKPALLSGSDSESLGLIKIQAKEVFALSTIVQSAIPNTTGDTEGGKQPLTCNHQKQMENKTPRPCTKTPTPSHKITIPRNRRLPKAGELTKDDILKEYADNFQGLGNLGPPVHFQMDQTVHPVQMPVHRIPVAKRQKEKETLDRYVEKGIMAKVDEPTPWCSNELIKEIHQMPTLNEQLHKLSSAKCFSLVDAKEGFLQIPPDEDSSYKTTMHTSYGRYRLCRLPFGVSSAPEEFEIKLSAALEGLDGIISVADDILVYGEGTDYENAKEDHDRRFVALMERCLQKNIKLNPDKLKFKQREVKFMGYIISDKGMQADPAKVKTITDMPTPENKAALVLTHEGVPYKWSSIQEEAFKKAKMTISSAPVLMYYDLQKPVVLQTDASDIALGGALLQPNNEGKLQSVAFTSCSLSPTEQSYSQIEKEYLAICNCFQKFDQWLYGKSDIEVHTDHEPLETIMKKPLNKAPARLQRMLMKLQRYRFKLTYKKGIIYKGDQVLIPQSMHSEMLQRIHVNHYGAESCIRMAREVLFWPGMRKSIQDSCDACSTCAQYGRATQKEPMLSLPIPTLPCQLVSQDIFESNQEEYLKTIAHFARYGVPKMCHTDNGPQFISQEYKDFATVYGFHHTTSFPYHSKGNDRAEAAVKVSKDIVEKSKDVKSSLLNYRNTPPKGHSYSPAQRMFMRQTRSTLPTPDHLLKPSAVDFNMVHQNIIRKRQKSKTYYDRSAGPENTLIDIGSYVYAKPPPNRRGQPWSYDKITGKEHPRSYTIWTGRSSIRRNRTQIRLAAPPPYPQQQIKRATAKLQHCLHIKYPNQIQHISRYTHQS